jgi:hypothetical protein
MAGLKVDKTITLLIIAKSSWNEGLCYLGYDQSSGKILRPVVSPNHCTPEDSGIMPWGEGDDFQVGAYYTFKLPKFLNIHDATNYSVSLPHRRDDLLVLEDDVIGPMLPWIEPLEPHESRTYATSFKTVSPLYRQLRPLAEDNIEDVFGLHFNFCERYIKKGTDCPSVGVFRCWKSKLDWCSNDKPRIMIHGDVPQENRFLPLTAPNAEKYEDFINSGGEDESVLLILSLGRPFTANFKFAPPRCYLLVVGLVRKYVYNEVYTHPEAGL